MTTHRWPVLGCVLLLILLSGSLTAWGGRTTPAAAAPPGVGGRALGSLVQADGTLNLRSGFQGTLDPTGWRMDTTTGGAPRFVPAAPAASGDENWDTRFDTLGTDGPVQALAVSGTDLYVGGTFTAAGGVPANNIARWDGTSWSALGSGTNSTVLALAVIGTDLFAGGFFSQAGGISASRIARWNGTSWSALGSGTDAAVRALAVFGTNLFVGGDFTTAGGGLAAFVARWNSGSWTALGSGTNNQVFALAVIGMNLYVGGRFTTAGGVSANRVARWNGLNWSALGSGTDNRVFALAVSGTDLYAGGLFTTAGGGTANRVARWNGTSWSALGSGTDNTANALAVNGTDLYAGGLFTTAGGVPANNIARWDGTSWSALGSGTDNTINALAVSGTDLFVGGLFTTAGGTASTNFGIWHIPTPPTPTNTPTNTPTDTPTNTPTDTPTNTPTDTPTNTPTDTPTNTPTNTPTDTPTNTNTPTDTPTNTPTNTPTDTPTNTNTPTDTPTNTPTNTPNVLWVDEVNVTETPNPASLQKVGVSASWDAGAISAQQILTGEGYVEMTIHPQTANVMFGLSKGNPSQDYASIKYALYVYTPTTSLLVYESGTYRGTFGAYAAGDRLRVGVTGGVVRYSRNGTAVYTSTVPVIAASYPLLLDTSLATNNSRVLDTSIAGASLMVVPTATPTTTPPATPITTWQNATSVNISGASLTKNTTTLGWDAGASSVLAIPSGDGYVQATVPDTTSRVIFGLSRGDTSRNYPEIDYAWQVYSGVMGIYENAISRGAFGSYSPGTLLRITVTGGVVRYYAGGVLKYTSLVPVPSGTVTGYPLLLDTSLYKGTLDNAAIGGSNVSLIAAATGRAPGAFRDVTADSAASPYLVCLTAQGVVRGYADGTFRPDVGLTRGQLVQVLATSWRNPAIPPTQQTFWDVKPGSAFWGAAESLANWGLLHGYKDDSLRPDAAATRGQAAGLLVAVAGLTDSIPMTRQTFRDVPAGSAAWLAVERLAAHKLVRGYADGTFRPAAALTRGQMVQLVGRTLYPGCQAAPVSPSGK